MTIPMHHSSRPAKVNVRLPVVLLLVMAALGTSFIAAHQVRRSILSKMTLTAGEAAFEKQDWRTALKRFREYLGDNPDDVEILKKHAQACLSMRVDARLNTASTLYEAGDAEKAEAVYREILEQHPDNARVLNDLAWIVQERHHRYDDALELANTGLSLAPGNVHLLDTRGTILSNMPDRLAEAKSDFEKIVELPCDTRRKARTLLQLGRICVKLNEITDAKRHLKDALEIDQKTNVLTPDERFEITSIVQHSGT